MMPRLLLAVMLCLATLLPPAAPVAQAANDTRTLYLYYTHNGTTGRFTYKRNGKFDQKVLNELNVFLADWRTKEPTKMDPALFDLLWSVYNAVGASQPINIVSSYRSPKTNAMLRSKSENSGVAKNSQHMQGKAIDFFIPGINLSRLREVAMQHQVGGVGYYPTSGSPFVHLDTASVRAWPRMTRAQLKKIFPDGKTLHLPTDGTPLSASGRAYAQAEWTKCHTVPCNGRVNFSTSPGIMIAEADGGIAPIPQAKPKDLYARGKVQLASLGADPAQRLVQSIAVNAPVPQPRPDALAVAALPTKSSGTDTDYAAWEALGAPVPAIKSARLALATRGDVGADPDGSDGSDGSEGMTALAAIETDMPKPRVLMTPPAEVVTAYAPEARGQQTLRDLIQGQPATVAALMPSKLPASLPKPAPLDPADPLDASGVDELVTASLGDVDVMSGLFEMTFNALAPQKAPKQVADALAALTQHRQAIPTLKMRPAELVAPELDHVNDTLVQPVPMSDSFWAVMNDAEGHLDKGTELGPLTGTVEFLPTDAPVESYGHFTTGRAILVAAR